MADVIDEEETVVASKKAKGRNVVDPATEVPPGSVVEPAGQPAPPAPPPPLSPLSPRELATPVDDPAAVAPRPPASRRTRRQDVLAGTVAVASFPTLEQVEGALRDLSDGEFPIEHATIVGTDLRLVERVRGRLTLWRAAGYGAAGGAWLGALIAAFAAIFAAGSFGGVLSMLFGGIVLGLLFGAVFGLAGFVVAGQHQITGDLVLVASRYELRTDPASADRVRGMLLRDRPDGMTLVDAGTTADVLLARP